MGIRVQIRIIAAVLPEEYIQVEGQIRGIFQPYFFLQRLLCRHLRPLCLLFFKGRNRLLDRQDFSGNADKLLRVFKLLPVFLHEVRGKGCKIFLPQANDQEVPGNNIIDVPIFIIERPV